MIHMRLIFLSLLLASLLLNGCLKIESKGDKPSATPQVIYVNVTSSPQIIVTVQTTVIPTVTEKIVIASATTVPIPRPKGGLEDLGVRTEYVRLDIQKAANADYHHSPFIYHDASGKSLYPSLKEGEIAWNRIPFAILPDYKSSGKWSVISTAYDDFYSVNFIAGRNRLSEIYLLVMGSFRKGESATVGNINVNYEDGIVQGVPVISNTNIWNYEEDENYPIPKEKLAWESMEDGQKQKLTAFNIAIEQPLTPIGGITIKKAGAGINGFAIFSATGVKKFRAEKISLTQTEFQLPTYSRDYATTLPEGAMINYDDSTGKRIYRQKGIFTAPIFDGETDLADWKKIEWVALMPTGTGVKVFVKTGSDPKGLFTNWIEVINGEDIPKDARLLQWKAEMTTADPGVTPVLRSLALTYENPE